MTAHPRPAVIPPGPWRFHATHETPLDNGLRVIVVPIPGQYVVSAGLYLDAPLTLEPASLEGVAALMASTLTEGTDTHPGPLFTQAVEDCGAVLDAAAGHSHTHVLVDVPAAHLAPALHLLAEAVREPTLTDDDVARHRQILLANIEQQLATGAGQANNAVRCALIDPSQRSSRPAHGSPDTVTEVTGAAVRAHHRAVAGPRGSVLVISGDVDRDALTAAADAFEGWTNPDQVLGLRERPIARPGGAWLIDRPGSVQADVRWGWFTIDRTDPRWPALQIATHALGGAYLSRLNKVLREEKGFSYGVSLVNNPMRHGGFSHTHGSFRTEVVGEAVGLMPSLLDVRSSPLTSEEVVRARDYIIGTAPLRYATASGVTLGVMGLLAAGLGTDSIEAQLAAYAEVTPEQATQTASELFDLTGGALVVVGDAAALEAPLRDTGRDVTVIPPGSSL